MQANNWLRELFEELKRRRVIRVATLYVIAFWPIIQIVDILSPTLDLPDSIIRYLVFAFIGGFPVMLILAWVFDINRDGIHVASKESRPGEESVIIGGNKELLIVGMLLLLVMGLFVVQGQMDEQTVEVVSVPEVNIRSIAVLPFDSYSEVTQDQLFADGLTEELLTVLSRVKELRVVARTSSFAYRGVSKNVIEIGKELDVSLILEGSVRRNDINDTIRVTAQLIETARGSHLWTQTYDREYKDIFKIQDDIAASVVDKLEITLLGKDREKIQSRSSASPEAMVANSMGRAELARRTEVSLKDGARFFKKAIRNDPNYADAYAGLAETYTLLVNYDYEPAEEYLPLAQEAVDRALAIEPESGISHAVQGLIHMQKKQGEQAIDALRKAMTLNPSNAMAVMWYAGLMKSQTDQLIWYEKAYELDPRSPVVGYNVANLMLEQGREAEAMVVFARIVEADPFYPSAYQLVAKINEQRGRLDEALNQYKRAYSLQPNIDYSVSIARLYADLGDFESSQEWIAKLSQNLPEQDRYQLDWLQIQSYAANNNIGEVEPLLLNKVKLANENGATRNTFLDAAWAAYLLDDVDRVIWAYEKAQALETNNEHMINMHKGFYLEAAVAAAYAYKTIGEHERKRQAIEKINARFDKVSGKRIDPQIWYLKALLSSIEDDNQMALFHLQRAVDEGWREHWRPGVEPIFQELVNDTNFQSMMAGLETRMNIMREQLMLASSFDSDWAG
ncbi:MAG: tetratricopeptide repeat protein [Gammaproteobacteria bacterium]|nr:tetratricopeptide repeat protein [Gammaproteobacteria bacterium]